MSDGALTLSMLGGLEADSSGLPVTAEERDKLLKEMRKATAIEGLSAYDISGRLLDYLGESFRKPVANIMAEVWRQRKELRDAAAKGKANPNIEGNIELYDHSIAYTLHPSVDIQANNVSLGKMRFDCKANLRLQGIQLVFKNGCITRLKAGKLTSTIGVEYKSIVILPPCKKTVDVSLSIPLPRGGIRFADEPIALVETPPPG